MVFVIIRRCAEHHAEVGVSREQAVRDRLTQHEQRAHLVRAAVADADGSADRVKLRVDIEPIDVR